jgi:hypothetical protein
MRPLSSASIRVPDASVERTRLLPSSKEHAILDFAMAIEVNQGVVGDTAKLIMHRLIARQIRRDPALVEKAKIAHARQADQFEGWPFVREWGELLSLPPDELTSKLISRDREMVRLRNSSPFYLCEGIDFGDYKIVSASAVRREGSRNETWRAIRRREDLEADKKRIVDAVGHSARAQRMSALYPVSALRQKRSFDD